MVIVWWLDLQLPLQSLPITTKIVSSNPAHAEVYSIQHYVIKFVSDLRQVSVFFEYSNETDRHNITELLLKVTLNTIQNQPTKFTAKKQYNWYDKFMYSIYVRVLRTLF